MDLTMVKKELELLGIPVPDEIPLDAWAATLTSDPTRNLASLIGVTTVLFYLAERDENPKVNSVWDALVYTTTCLSVGYGDIFARTPVGKVLGSALMTMGPSMASKALDGRREPPAPDPTQQEILETLKQILARLEAPR